MPTNWTCVLDVFRLCEAITIDPDKIFRGDSKPQVVFRSGFPCVRRDFSVVACCVGLSQPVLTVGNALTARRGTYDPFILSVIRAVLLRPSPNIACLILQYIGLWLHWRTTPQRIVQEGRNRCLRPFSTRLFHAMPTRKKTHKSELFSSN